MAKSLTVAGQTFEYPENRDQPGWGEENTAWAEAVTEVLADVASTGDILRSSATIGNNVAVATAINGFAFDPLAVRAAVAEFSIHRVTSESSSGAGDNEERAEVGQLFITYKSSTGFELARIGSGGSGVTLTITSAGQIEYTSDLVGGTGHIGTIRFRARALPV